MGEIGGPAVKDALNSPKGTHVMAPAYSWRRLPDVQETITKLAANPLPANIFRPRTVAISTLGEESADSIALTLMEVLRWMKLEPDSTIPDMPRSTVISDLQELGTVETCVKAVSRLPRLPYDHSSHSPHSLQSSYARCGRSNPTSQR